MKFLRDLSKPHYLSHLNRKVDTIGVFGLEVPEKYHLTVMCNKKGRKQHSQRYWQSWIEKIPHPVTL